MLIGYRPGEFGARCKVQAQLRHQQEEHAAARLRLTERNSDLATQAYNQALNADPMARSRMGLNW